MVALEPAFPSVTDRRRKDQLVPQLNKLIGIDVELHVVLDPLSEHLLIDAGSVGSVGEVVDDRRSAPANMERELNSTSRLDDRWVVQVLGLQPPAVPRAPAQDCGCAPSCHPLYAPESPVPGAASKARAVLPSLPTQQDSLGGARSSSEIRMRS